MARINVTVPDELMERVGVLRGVVFSKVLQDGLRALLSCDHDQLECSRCGQLVTRAQVGADSVERFFRSAMWEIGDLVETEVGTAEGAARILKRVGIEHGVKVAEQIPLPRPSRAVRESHRPITSPNQRSKTG
jgi:hypothetical protein